MYVHMAHFLCTHIIIAADAHMHNIIVIVRTCSRIIIYYQFKIMNMTVTYNYYCLFYHSLLL